jgi:hypothetical protein
VFDFHVFDGPNSLIHQFQGHILSDRQKGCIKKMNGGSELGMILDELLRNANRNKKGLVTKAVDLPTCFFSQVGRRRFPDICQGESSVFEMKRNRSEKIARKRRAK